MNNLKKTHQVRNMAKTVLCNLGQVCVALHPVLSRAGPSYSMLPRTSLSCVTSDSQAFVAHDRPVLCYPEQACPVLPRTGQSYVIQSRPVLSCPVQSSPVLPSTGLSFVIQSRPVLCCPGQACPVLYRAGLSCVVQDRPVLCCPG